MTTATATATAQGAPPAAWDGLPRHTPVSELMHRQVVTVDPWTDHATLVTALHGLVTDAQQRPVGLVCRCDLLGAVCRDDAEIRSEVLHLAVAAETGADRATLRVDCEHGRVLLEARTARRSQAYTLLGRVRAVEGVVEVAETLRWDTDDQPVAMRQHPSHQL